MHENNHHEVYGLVIPLVSNSSVFELFKMKKIHHLLIFHSQRFGAKVHQN